MRKNLKIRSTNFEVSIGNVNKNKEEIKKLVKKADEEGVDILSLPELSLTGASLYDGYKDLTNQCEQALYDLIEFSKEHMVFFTVGFPLSYNNKIYNAIALIINGRIATITTKKNLGVLEKNVFDNDMPEDECINAMDGWQDINMNWYTVNGLSIAITIGEDELMTIPRSLAYKTITEAQQEIILNPSAQAKLVLNEDEIINRVKFIHLQVGEKVQQTLCIMV